MSPLAMAEAGQSSSPPSSSPSLAKFCLSPDMDTKAGNFIARLRPGLSLEKENSMRDRDSTGKSRD